MRRRVLIQLSTQHSPATRQKIKRYEVSFSFHEYSLRTKLFLVFYQPHTLGQISLSELPFVTGMMPHAREELGVDDGPCPALFPSQTGAAGRPPPARVLSRSFDLATTWRSSGRRCPPGRASPAERGVACRRVASGATWPASWSEAAAAGRRGPRAVRVCPAAAEMQ